MQQYDLELVIPGVKFCFGHFLILWPRGLCLTLLNIKFMVNINVTTETHAAGVQCRLNDGLMGQHILNILPGSQEAFLQCYLHFTFFALYLKEASTGFFRRFRFYSCCKTVSLKMDSPQDYYSAFTLAESERSLF